MATYQELRTLFPSDKLLEKVEVACVIAANNLINGATPSVDETKWAAAVFNAPRAEAKKAVMAVLAENSSATTVQILGATDSAIQTNVDNVVPTLVIAMAGV